MLRKTLFAFACVSALVLAAPASAGEVKVTCSKTAITYTPMTGQGDMPLFNLQPLVVGATCITGPADQHLLKIGDADPIAFSSADKMKTFLSALGRFADDYTKKKTSQK